MVKLTIDPQRYPNFVKYAEPMTPNPRPLMGRKHIIRRIKAIFAQRIQRNAFLLGEAGIGKTTIVRGCVKALPNYAFFQINLDAMGLKTDMSTDNSSLDISVHMQAVLQEAHEIQKTPDVHLVLFVDEIHRLAQVSPVTLQSIKTELAESGENGMQFIFATTREEHEEYLEKDTALNERCTLLYLDELGKKATIKALASLTAETEQRMNTRIVIDDNVYEQIYTYTERYLPAQAQPRKSLNFLDHMLGEYFGNGYAMDQKLIDKVLHDYYSLQGDRRIDLQSLSDYLHSRIYGQNEAIQIMLDRLCAAFTGLTDPTRPKMSAIFTGSTGVGKTEMAKAITTAVFGKEGKMIRFDMSEYSLPDSVERLRDSIAALVRANSHCVLLFDEIEKSAENIAPLFLQMLDDGRLSDKYGRQVSFRDCYIFFTTNLGANIYERLAAYVDPDARDDRRDDQTLASYMPLLKEALVKESHKRVKPEFLGRLDAVVPFNPLRQTDYRKIAKKRLRQLEQKLMRQYGIRLVIDDRVLDYLSDDAVDDIAGRGGGRQVNTAIENEIASKIGRLLLANPSLRSIAIAVTGQLRQETTEHRKGNAVLQVGEYQPRKRSV